MNKLIPINELIDLTVEWGYDKGIIQKGDALSQLAKTMAELGELADNLAKGKDVKDDIGDVVVTLIMQSAIQGTTLHECLQIAYDEIKGRTGKMVGGTFVKDEPSLQEVPVPGPLPVRQESDGELLKYEPSDSERTELAKRGPITCRSCNNSGVDMKGERCGCLGEQV